MMPRDSKHKVLLSVISAIILLAGAGFLLYTPKTFPPLPTVTQSVEVSPSPQPSSDDGWDTFTDSALGITFRYPIKFPASYIDPTAWPPQVAVSSAPLTCKTSTGAPTVPKSESLTVNGRTYCVTTTTEGAAGSIYAQYTYATAKDNKVVTFTFTLREVQCANYEDPQKTDCEQERASFDLDTLMDKIAQTFKFNAN